MANTNQQQQQPPQQYTSDQVKAILQFASGDPNAKISQEAIDAYTRNPGMFQSAAYGGYGPSTAYGQAPVQSITGAQPLGPMLNMISALAPQPQPQQAPAQPQQPQLAPAQPMPTVKTTPLQAQSQQQQAAPMTMNVPQASAQSATPLFSLGQMPGLFQSQLPQAQNPLMQPPLMQPPPDQQQPMQRFQSGGPVLPSGDWRDPKTGTSYSVDPAFASQLGLGNLTADQLKSLGYNPENPSQGTTQSAAQVGALYQPALLGAAALQMPAVINLPPSNQMSNAQGGVATSPGGAIVGSSIPQTPQGPWLTNPSVFAKAAMPTLSGPGAGWSGSATSPLSPTAQANAAQMPQMNITPANAANLGAVAGKPNTDTVPAMLTPHEFVLNPGATAAMGPQNLARINQQFEGGPRPMAPPAPGPGPGPGPAAAGAMTALATQPAQAPQLNAFAQGFQHGFMGMSKQPTPAATPPPPAKMQSGGYVFPQQEQQGPMRMQTGGYVYPQQQQEPLRMQGGGFVDPTLTLSSGYDDDAAMSHKAAALMGLPGNPWYRPDGSSRQQQPARIQVPQQSAQQPQQPQPQPQQSSSSQQQTPGAPMQQQPALGSWAHQTMPAAQPAAAEPQAFNPLSGYGMPGGQAQPNWTANQVRNYASGGTGYGPGSGEPTKNALSTIGSGLSQASQALANVASQRWQMQPNAIPPPPSPDQYQRVTLQQPSVV